MKRYDKLVRERRPVHNADVTEDLARKAKVTEVHLATAVVERKWQANAKAPLGVDAASAPRLRRVDREHWRLALVGPLDCRPVPALAGRRHHLVTVQRRDDHVDRRSWQVWNVIGIQKNKAYPNINKNTCNTNMN